MEGCKWVDDVDGAEVTCKNLFGQPVAVAGSIRQVDLDDATVTIGLG